MIRLIALDLDGTLFDNKRMITDFTRNVLLKCTQAGIVCAFCTGRITGELAYVRKMLPHIQYAVTCNGAIISDFITGFDFACGLLSMDDVRTIYRKVSRRGSLFELYADGSVFCDERALQNFSGASEAAFMQYITESRIMVENFETYIADRTEPVAKVNIFFPNKILRDTAFAAVKNTHYAIYMQSERSLEFNMPQVSKGSGLLHLAKNLGIEKSETMAIGDGDNDLSLRDGAGILVAMGNACEQLKQTADYISLPNSQDGCAHAILHYTKLLMVEFD